MNKRRRRIFAILLVASATALIVWLTLWPRETIIAGQPLKAWLEILKGNTDDGIEAATILRANGTNVLPELLTLIQSGNVQDRRLAVAGFKTLGPIAKPAASNLLDLLSANYDRSTFRKEEPPSHAQSQAFAAIGPEAFSLVIGQLTNSDPRRRVIAESLVRYFHSTVTNFDKFAEDLRSTNRYTRTCAANSLWISEPRQGSGLWRWLRLAILTLESEDPYVRDKAVFLLKVNGIRDTSALECKRRNPDLGKDAIALLLTEELAETFNFGGINAANNLELLGQDAIAAIPNLVLLAGETNSRVGPVASRVLRKIVPASLQSGCSLVDRGVTRGPTAEHRIALVFTGHEFAEGGQTLLDELAKRKGSASFFFTGIFLENPDFRPLVQRIVRERHFLGPHSDDHLLYCAWDSSKTLLVDRDLFRSDLLRNLAKIEPYGVARPRYFLPPYEHYNEHIANWSKETGLMLINFTPGTRSNADYTGEADTNFVSSQAIFDSILKREREDPHGLNGFILLLHLGSGPGRTDKFHTRFGELLDTLTAKGYQFVRVDELLETKAEDDK